MSCRHRNRRVKASWWCLWSPLRPGLPTLWLESTPRPTENGKRRSVTHKRCQRPYLLSNSGWCWFLVIGEKVCVCVRVYLGSPASGQRHCIRLQLLHQGDGKWERLSCSSSGLGNDVLAVVNRIECLHLNVKQVSGSPSWEKDGAVTEWDGEESGQQDGEKGRRFEMLITIVSVKSTLKC